MDPIFNIYTITSLFVIFLSVLGITFYFIYKYDKKVKPLEKKNLFLQDLIDKKIGRIIIFDDQKTYFMNEKIKNKFQIHDPGQFNFLNILLNSKFRDEYHINELNDLIPKKRFSFKFISGNASFSADFYFEDVMHQGKKMKLGLGIILD